MEVMRRDIVVRVEQMPGAHLYRLRVPLVFVEPHRHVHHHCGCDARSVASWECVRMDDCGCAVLNETKWYGTIGMAEEDGRRIAECLIRRKIKRAPSCNCGCSRNEVRPVTIEEAQTDGLDCGYSVVSVVRLTEEEEQPEGESEPEETVGE
jgi:hypothetical protein